MVLRPPASFFGALAAQIFLPEEAEAQRGGSGAALRSNFPQYRACSCTKGSGLRCERCLSRTQERLPKTAEHDQVGVEPDAVQRPHSERREAVVVLQAPELTLDCGAAPEELQCQVLQSSKSPSRA